MKVKELADKAGVTADTVRFYTRKNILVPERRSDNGYKEYSARDLGRLRFVLSARQLGFTVQDIVELCDKADDGKSPCPTARKIIMQRLQETESRFRDMLALRDRMQAAVSEWEQKPDKEPNGHTICHLIEGFFDDKEGGGL